VSQKLTQYLMLVSLLLVAVALVSEIIGLWPVLRPHITTFFLHIGAVLCITAIALRTHRKQAVLPSEIMLLSAIMLATWYADLRLIGQLAVR
jgi:hypothetical protein